MWKLRRSIRSADVRALVTVRCGGAAGTLRRLLDGLTQPIPIMGTGATTAISTSRSAGNPGLVAPHPTPAITEDMVDDDIPSEIKLTPGQWVRLPGTGVEVMLRGKYRDSMPAETVWWRHDPTTGAGYWDLTQVYPRLLVRGAEPGEQPTTLEEATRPRIRRGYRRRSI